jgi:hypothetical protein
MAAVVVGQEVDGRTVGAELRSAGPPVEALGELAGGAVDHVDQQQRVVRRLGVGRQRLPDAHQHRAVGGEAGRGQIGQRIVGERTGVAVGRPGEHDPRPAAGQAVRYLLGAGEESAVGGEGELLTGTARRDGVRGQVTQLDRLVRCRLLGRQPTGPEEMRRRRSEVVVPGPHRIGLVQDRRHAGVLAPGASLLVRLGVRAAGHRRGRDHHVAAVARDRDGGDPSGAGQHQPCLTTSRGEAPQPG